MEPREFVKEYGIQSLVCCFSGGKDSLVATHHTLSELEGCDITKYVVYVDTSVMCPGVTSWVEDFCREYGWPLTVLQPKPDFWTLAAKWRWMPRPNSRWCCWRLKLKPIHLFVRDLPAQRAEVTGLRREESLRRRNLRQVVYFKKSRSWKYAPILELKETDVIRYLRVHDLPIPPHYKIGVKETCLCGAYGSREQMAIICALFPDFFQKFVDLEEKLDGRSAFYFNGKRCFAKDFLKQKTLKEPQ